MPYKSYNNPSMYSRLHKLDYGCRVIYAGVLPSFVESGERCFSNFLASTVHGPQKNCKILARSLQTSAKRPSFCRLFGVQVLVSSKTMRDKRERERERAGEREREKHQRECQTYACFRMHMYIYRWKEMHVELYTYLIIVYFSICVSAFPQLLRRKPGEGCLA